MSSSWRYKDILWSLRDLKIWTIKIFHGDISQGDIR
jgi:hypothetical protein